MVTIDPLDLQAALDRKSNAMELRMTWLKGSLDQASASAGATTIETVVPWRPPDFCTLALS
jgi:hypothetical protein